MLRPRARNQADLEAKRWSPSEATTDSARCGSSARGFLGAAACLGRPVRVVNPPSLDRLFGWAAGTI
jgi:hypothetical protein